ncbi:DUF4124 domain-containing protein [Kineobactrum salinum]|uniref:DUF4124 domain-containing protein n=1 Tax=Kineobactrum salinum TaxID=2708301 RepID=A0A6C0U1V0_9GAMM|nr:DUF4124 domain-containing protein [Kineobactrum salinum]QIB65773.1 DUF4124 domain-containing protein [Kineobactrum salinum]
MIYTEMMTMRGSILLCSLLALWQLPVAATTVYKSVDERGVVRFSDMPPADQAPVETLEIPVSVTAASPDESLRQLQRMRETTDRMASARQEREQQRELRRRRQQEAAPASTDSGENGKADKVELVRYQYIYVPVARRPWRPHPPHRPPHAGPPWKSPHFVRDPNSQLMRPIVSSR